MNALSDSAMAPRHLTVRERTKLAIVRDAAAEWLRSYANGRINFDSPADVATAVGSAAGLFRVLCDTLEERK